MLQKCLNYQCYTAAVELGDGEMLRIDIAEGCGARN